MDYKAQLKDPRWQKKRLEILERDEFCCRSCMECGEELHVHHITYFANSDLWDYDNKFLITLCNNCHTSVHQMKLRNRYIIDVFSQNVDISLEMNIILESLLYLKNECFGYDEIMDVRKYCTNVVAKIVQNVT